MSCPNISHPHYKALVQEYGAGKALSLWEKNGEVIPTLEQAKKLVSPTDKHITQVLNAIKSSLPAEVGKAITVVQNVPRGILGRDDLFLSLKEILNDKGINDELLINWAGINRVNPKAVQSESEITGIIEKKYNNLKKVESHPALKANKLALESFNKWVSALNKYPVAFRDMMLSHAIKYLDPQRRSKYVLQLSDVALTNAYGMVINKPHELNRIGKLYDQEVLRAVNEAGDHEPSASGNGYWVHIPRTANGNHLGYNSYEEAAKVIKELEDEVAEIEKIKEVKTYPWAAYESSDRNKIHNLDYTKTRLNDLKKGFEHLKPEDWTKNSAQYKVNVELLRKLSPSTWCTASGMAPHYVENYDNYLLIVDGVTVAGVEAGDKGANGKVQVKEVTSRANNGVASIDHIDDITAFFEKHNLDTNNSTLKRAQQAKDAGKTDAIQHGYDPNEQDDEYERERDRQERWNIDEHNGEHEYDPPEYQNDEPDWEGELQRQQELEAVQAITTVKDALHDIETNRLPVLTNFYALPQNVRDNEELANKAVEFNPHNITYVSLTAPFYNELVTKAVTRQPNIFQYLPADVRLARNDLHEIYRNQPDDELPFSKTNNNQIQGYYDPRTDKVVVVASNTPVDEAAKVGIHEVAHRGMIRMAKELGGTKELNKILFNAEKKLMEKVPELLKRTGHKNIEALVKDYGFDINSEEGKAKLLTELAARWAETLVDKPKPSWWKEFLTSIANWIKKFTGKVLNENEINELVGGFVKYGTQQETKQQELFSQQPIDYREAVNRVVTGFKGLIPAYPNSRTMWNYYTTAKDTKLANGTIAKEVDRWISNNPHLQSVGVVQDANNKNVIQLVPIKTNAQYQLSSESAPADTELNRILTDYAQNELGGKVNLTDQIVVDGKVISANAVTDVVNRTIDYVANRAKIDTLPEEVSHIWVHWLPKNSLLLADMLRDIKKRPIYQQVMKEYSSNSHYQSADGTVDEHKIALEAIGKQIAGTIVGQYKDSKSKGLLQRLIDWITRIFKGKQTLDSYQTVAKEILSGSTKQLDNELQQAVNRGLSQESTGSAFKTAISVFTGIKRTSDKSKEESRGFEERLRSAGLWYEGNLGEEFEGGTEHVVYKNGNDIIKVNHAYTPSEMQEHLYNLQVHNYLFPETAYTLLGFTRYQDKICPVLKQQRVVDTGGYKQSVVDEVLKNKGFNKVTAGVYRDEELGVNIWDVKGDNILFQEGIPYFIDPKIVLDEKVLKNLEAGNSISPEQEANNRGEYFFQLTSEEIGLVEAQMKGANKLQQQIIKDIYLDPHIRLILDKATHVYSDLGIENPTIYTSVTTAINGDKGIVGYDANRQWGEEFDGIMSDIIQGKDIRATQLIADGIRDQLINYLQGIITGLTADGSIALTQVIVADKISKIAGSIDLLLVTPIGDIKVIDLKTSWKSYKDSGYHIANDRGTGAILTGKFSKAQEHAIQVGTYAKLIELLGYRVAERKIFHIHVENEGDTVTAFKSEGMDPIAPSQNITQVNQIVPTKYEGKDRLAELRGEAQPDKIVLDEKQEAKNAKELEERFGDIHYAYKTWREYLNSLKYDVGLIPGDEDIRKIDNLIHAMELAYHDTGDSTTTYLNIYKQFLIATNQHLNGISTFLKTSVDTPNYIRGVFLAEKYIDTFKDLYHTENFTTGHPELESLYKRAEQTLIVNRVLITKAIQDYCKSGVIKDWSTNPIYIDKTPVTLEDGTESTKGEQALIKAVTRNKDISQATMLADTIGNSGIPLLENTSKIIASARATVQENLHHLKEGIRNAANSLVKLMGTKDAKTLYNWMFQRDGNGKKNGQIISQIGTLYKEELAKVTDPLYHIVNGRFEKKHYIEGDTLTPEQLQWNKDLYLLRKAFSDFQAAEVVTGDWKTRKVSSSDGMYHQLTPEFRKEREKFMKQNAFRYGEWVPKNASDPEYLEWRTKNYDWVQWVGPILDKNGEPTGQVERKMKYFIKKENSRARMEINDGTGRILWDKEYMRIMTGTTAIDKAQKAYYEAYVSTMRTQVEKLPAGAMTWFEKGFIPMIEANWVSMLGNKDVKMASVITDQLRNFFEITAYTNDYDDRARQGTPSQSVPIMYMGTLQSQKRVAEVKAELDKVMAEKGNKTGQALKDWLVKKDALVALLKRESAKMTADQIHPDLTVGLEAFLDMSENFHIMTSIEDKVLAVKEQLKTMEFEKKNGKVVQGTDSNAYRLYSHVLDTLYYGEQAAHSFTEAAVNKIMKLTSSISIPLNLFGMLNNKFMARLNNRIDSIGSNFFSKKSYNEAILEYNTKHIPGFLSTKAQYIGDKTYDDKKNGSLYEALTNDFHMVRHLKTADGRIDFLSKIGAYAGYEAGEWEVQSLVGNAILRDIQMGEVKDGKLTGKTLSVHDAYSFDPNTGKATLGNYVYLDKDGNIASDQAKAKHLIVNRIHETNDRIHGNYDPANKIMLERNFAGKMILQFHKWVYPNFKQRYQAGKFDENLGGGMDIEGRYKTLYGLLKAYVQLGQLGDRWNELTDHQKANLKKDLADALYIAGLFALATIIKSATEGLGDDDPYTKRMKNLLLYQLDRGIQETSIFVPIWGALESYNMVTNPIAATNTIKNFSILLRDMVQFPFQDEDSRYIQRGNFKEESKVYKDFLKTFPGGGNVNRIINSWTISSFYLGK